MEPEKNALTEETAPEAETPETQVTPDTETETPEAEEVSDAETAAPMDAETAPDEEEIPLSITVDDGLKRIPIQNKLGEEIGVFAFRPTDVDIVARFNYMVEHWDEVTKALDGVEETPDGIVDLNDPKVMAAMEAAKAKLFELCDYTLGGAASKAFFGSMNPFSPIDGNLYCYNVLTAVGAFISRYFKRETLQLNRRVTKYLPTDHLRKGGKKRLK